MALTERSRASLFRGLSGLIDDEEAVGEMLSYFPARDLDEPVTREYLDARLADLRAELRSEMATKAELAELRAEVRQLDRRMTAGFAELTALVEARSRETLRWTITTMVGLVAIMIAAVGALT